MFADIVIIFPKQIEHVLVKIIVNIAGYGYFWLKQMKTGALN